MTETETPTHASTDPGMTDRLPPRRLLYVAGGLTVLFGLLAVGFPLAASFGFTLAVGLSFVAVGAIEIVRAFAMRRWRRAAWHVGFGLLAILGGGLMVVFPFEGVLTLTMLVAAFLLVGGTVKAVAAFDLRPRAGWGWMLGSGLLSALLGLVLVLGLPGSALWTLGLLVGLDLVMLGAAQIALAAGLHREG